MFSRPLPKGRGLDYRVYKKMNNLLLPIEDQKVLDIPGLDYIPDYICVDEERALIDVIDQQPWLNDLKRRVQHYGYKYDYKARGVTYDLNLGPLPDWIQNLCTRLKTDSVFESEPDQVIVNEYMPGQGISAHVDCIPCFGETIASLSMGSAAFMEFAYEGQKEELYLEPCSLLVLSGSARRDWTHSIPARKSDLVDGFRVRRGRRISLTFRTVILRYY